MLRVLTCTINNQKQMVLASRKINKPSAMLLYITLIRCLYSNLSARDHSKEKQSSTK